MTPTDLDELDAKVAVQVMGLIDRSDNDVGYWSEPNSPAVFRLSPTRDPRDTDRVIQEMTQQGYRVEVTHWPNGRTSAKVSRPFCHCFHSNPLQGVAVCLAAVEAMEPKGD